MHIVITRVICLSIISVGARLYRIKELSERNESWALHKGTECGITQLNLFGKIENWNEKHERDFAPPGAKEKKEEGLPCYYVFHGIGEPCHWCGLKWDRVNDCWPEERAKKAYIDWLKKNNREFDEATWKKMCPVGGITKQKIDTDALQKAINSGENWAVSNQLSAGSKENGTTAENLPAGNAARCKERSHFFHIYYGKVVDPKDEKTITHVVESVADVTETVLEMPHLKKKQHAKGQPAEGPLPIGVVSPDDCRFVLAMNDAKWLRCRNEETEELPAKEDLLGNRCEIAYGRKPLESRIHDQENGDNIPSPCMESCPVQRVLDDIASGRPPASHKAITNHPTPAMVTAVPMLGPTGELRAVFEFIDDLKDLMAVEEGIRKLNAEGNELQIVKEVLSAFRSIVGGDRAVLCEFTNHGCTLVALADNDSERWSDVRADVRDNPLARFLQEKNRIKALDNLLTDPSVPDDLKTWSTKIREERRLLPAGPTLLVPLKWPSSSVSFVVAIERPESEPSGARSFSAEQSLYAELLASPAAAAIVRGREHSRRHGFIKAMNETAGVMTPEAALGELVKQVQPLLPEDISLTAFRFVRVPGLQDDDPEMRFVDGAGARFEAEKAREPGKWQAQRTLELSEKVKKKALKERTQASWPVAATAGISEGLLVLSDTRFIRVIPLIHVNTVLGCLVAESPCQIKEKAFPDDIKQFLNVVAEFGNVLLGRFELLTECMLSLYGHVLSEPWVRIEGHIQKLIGLDGKLPGPTDDLLREIRNAHEGICVGHKAWKMAGGEKDVLELQENVDILHIIRDAVANFEKKESRCGENTESTKKKEKQIRFAALPETLPPCCCDPAVIRSIIDELLTNAKKYTISETAIEVSAKLQENAIKVIIRNRVADKNINKKRVHEAFYRDPQNRNQEGTGLGLWQAAMFIAAHEGSDKDMDVTEEEGKTFVEYWFSLRCNVE